MRRQRSLGQAATARTEEAHRLNPAHLGSDFDCLKEEGLFEEVQTLAIKELVAYKLLELFRQKHVTKDALAKCRKTSRAPLERLLDPNNPSVTLATLSKAASALGCTLRVEFSDAKLQLAAFAEAVKNLIAYEADGPRTGQGGDVDLLLHP